MKRDGLEGFRGWKVKDFTGSRHATSDWEVEWRRWNLEKDESSIGWIMERRWDRDAWETCSLSAFSTD